MSLAILANADAVAQVQGSVVRLGVAPNTCHLAQADTYAHVADLVGTRLGNVLASASGTVAAFESGMVVALAGVAAAGDVIYLSAAVAGAGTNVSPAISVELGTAYNTFLKAGTWYAELLVPASATSPAPPTVATWPLDLCRYVFLDGDAGDDAKVGYIDAPLGTIFTPVQTAAVAVKTTHRINEIRPPTGAGRMVIVLMKPRASDVPYDHLVDDDGLGTDDRSDCEGYTLMITRASDLTNSMADRVALGFVTAIPGPNLDESFTIATVGSGPFGGTLMTLTGATLPSGWGLTKYRLRIKKVAGPTYYGSVIWGDPSGTPDPTTVLANLSGAPPSPGDKIWFERPSLVLHSFFEAIDVSNGGRFHLAPQHGFVGSQLRAYGFIIRGGQDGAEFRPGTRVAGAISYYSSFWVDGPSGAFISQSENGGSIYVSGSIADEEGNPLIFFASLGMWGPEDSHFGGLLTESIHVECSSFAESGDPVGGQGVVFNCKNLKLLETAAATVTLGDNLSDSSVVGLASVVGLRVGSLSVVFPGHTHLSSIRFVPPWISGTSPKGMSITPISNRLAGGTEVELLGASVFWGPEIAEPGVTLSAGMYTLYVSRGDLPGTGFSLAFDVVDSSKVVVSSWAAAALTGFEIPGGLKLVEYKGTGTNPNSPNLCPRGIVMQIVDSEGGGTVFPVGLVVGAVGASAPLQFNLAGSNPGQPRPTGILLTDCVQGGGGYSNNGYAVVGADEYMVGRLTTPATLDEGTLLYLDPTTPGYLTTALQPIQIGRILPIGTPSGQTYPVAWEPNESSSVGPSPVADWPLDVGRYIFLDGDNGNDANVGYIDAPLGTVFTPLQTTPVAVKTTHRINEIRPPTGAGRMVIVLMKPRANDTPYDHLVDDDGLGTDDRSDCEGYTLMFTRASDLTNSVADRKALGFVTAIPGPNGDGSFTIATVGSGTYGGTLLTLTGATLPAGWELTRYRLRYELAGGGTYYGSVIWGDPSDTPDPTTILANLGGSPLNPGDKIWIEKPTLVLHSFFEAIDVSNGGRFRQSYGDILIGGQLRAYGLIIRGGLGGSEFRPGTRVAGAVAYYSSNWVDGPSGALLLTSENGGSIYVSGSVSDEEGHVLIPSSLGMWGPKAAYFGGLLTESIHVENSSFAVSADPVSGGGVVFDCKRLTLLETAAATISLGDNFGDASVVGLAAVGGLRVGTLYVVFPGHTLLSQIRFIPPWISGTSPKGLSITPISNRVAGGTEVELFGSSVFWGPEIAEPGVTLSAGMYTLYVGKDDLLPGTGFRLLFDNVYTAKEVVSTWAAAGLTGFEIPGGLKLVVYNGPSSQNMNVPVLCPRGIVMEMVESEGGGTVFPVGLVVGAVGSSAPQRFNLAGSNPGQPRPTGILLTDCVQGGGGYPNSGYAVVGADEYMVGRLTTPAALDEGTLLYVDPTTPGYLTTTPQPIQIGRILPINTPSNPTYPIAWEPDENSSFGPPPVADWPLNVGRYIFLDGDNGNDANVGYIDAPLGTVFTPVQTTPVAVKTTHRINEIRPPTGAGRMVIVLMKPRANDAPYDHLIDDDALGTDDRSDCEGYTLMITRASDLTNSLTDRVNLGFVTAIPGPNLDESFTIATVGSGTFGGTLMTLTGATLPAGWELTKYRLRVEPAGGGTVYGSVIWGDPSSTPDPTTILANLAGPPPSPGDKIWIEKPSLVLHAFFEAVDCSNAGRFRSTYVYNDFTEGQLRAYGLIIRGGLSGSEFRPGTLVAGAVAYYSSIWVDGPSGAVITRSVNGGSINISGSVSDEEKNQLTYGSFGIWGPKHAFFGGRLTELVDVEYSSFAESADPVGGQGVVFDCKRLTLTEIAAATVTLGDSFGDASVVGLAAIGGLRVGALNIVFPGHTLLSSIRFVPPWISGTSPKGLNITPISNRVVGGTEIELLGSSVFWGPEIAEPGVTLASGMYTLYVGKDDLLPGTGFRLLFDSIYSAKEVVSTWGSAGLTGFEIPGGLKLVVYNGPSSTNMNVPVLCPRGIVMEIVEAEGGGTVFPAGLVVGAVGSSAPLRFNLAGSNPGQPRPTGILLTDCVQGGGGYPNSGYAVVGADAFMVGRLTTPAALDAGTLLYLDSTTPGNLTPSVPDAPLAIGRILPIGTPSNATCPIAWEPDEVPEVGTINAQVGTTYQIALSDMSDVCSLVTYDNVNPIAVTIPKSTTTRLPVGATINNQQVGTGKVTFVPEDGTVTLNPAATPSISAQWKAVTLIQTATNVWSMIGSLSA